MICIFNLTFFHKFELYCSYIWYDLGQDHTNNHVPTKLNTKIDIENLHMFNMAINVYHDTYLCQLPPSSHTTDCDSILQENCQNNCLLR